MIQTILTTVLSSAILLITPTAAPIPPTPQSVISRVLSNKNDVAFAVEQDNTTYTLKLKKLGDMDVFPLPELQKTFENNTMLLQPTTDAMISSDIFAIVPTVTPTAEPTEESAVVTRSIRQTPLSTASSTNGALADAAITYLGNCEAGMNPARNSGNGYYGAFQFSYGTWKSLNTGYERADLAPIDVQIAAVKQLLQRSSIYNQFPGCAAKMRSEGII